MASFGPAEAADEGSAHQTVVFGPGEYVECLNTVSTWGIGSTTGISLLKCTFTLTACICGLLYIVLFLYTYT